MNKDKIVFLKIRKPINKLPALNIGRRVCVNNYITIVSFFLMNLLKKLTVSSNKAILLSTHELHLALNVSDSVWIMKKGQPLLSGTPRQMMENGEIAKAFNLSETQIAESFRF